MINHLIRTSLLVLVLVVLPVTASSQRADYLQDGARVRLVPERGRTIVGTATLITSDSMSILAPGSSQSVRVGLRDATRVEVSTGVNRAKGALIYGLVGLGLGAAGGAALGAATPNNSSGCFPMCGRGASAYIGGVVLGLIGGIGGVVGGASKGWEGWRAVR